jgi:hypothetical protein
MPKLAYDLKLRKVGCVILQAVMGGDRNIAHRIGTEHWLTSLTPDLRVYQMTDEEVEQLVKLHGGKGL